MTVTALDSRRQHLGGSTIAAAAGIDPYCSPIRLWLEMTGRVEREETEAMRMGQRLEPVIFDALADRGYAVERTPGHVMYDESRVVIGHPDGFADNRTCVVETKATNRGAEKPHPWWEAQVQTYLHLARLDRAIIAQLAGLHLTVWEVERKQPVIDTLLALGEAFMGYVRRDEMPAPLGHRDDRDALLLAHPFEGGRVRETREVRDARRELALLLERGKAFDRRVDHLRAVVTDHMGSADVLLGFDDEVVATWKSVTSRRVDTARLKRERPDVYEEFSTETTTRRLVT